MVLCHLTPLCSKTIGRVTVACICVIGDGWSTGHVHVILVEYLAMNVTSSEYNELVLYQLSAVAFDS